MPTTFTAIWEAHAQYANRSGLTCAACSRWPTSTTPALSPARSRPTSQGGIGEIGATEVVASEMLGVYAEVAYDILPADPRQPRSTLEPFFRVEYVDTQYDVPIGLRRGPRRRRYQSTPPGSASSRFRTWCSSSTTGTGSPATGSAPDELNLGMGLAF